MQRAHLTDTISWFFILLFSYAAISKLISYDSFKAALSAAPLIAGYAGVFAFLIPVLEIFLLVLLIVPVTRFRGLYGCFMLLSLFTVYLIYMVLYEPELPCSCGGLLEAMSWTQHILFNLFCIALCAAALWFKRKQEGKEEAGLPGKM